MLQRVLLVEDHQRHPGPVVAAASAPPLGEGGRGGRGVAQGAEPHDHAALHRARVGGHRGQHLPAAQQVGREGLVLDVQAEHGTLPGRHVLEHRAQPGGQRVGVDRDRQVDDLLARAGQRLVGLVVEQPGLPRQPEHVSPAGVGSQGVDRWTSTWPAADSSARIRWLIALGVTCSRRAAASNVPCSTTATSASSWAGGAT